MLPPTNFNFVEHFINSQILRKFVKFFSSFAAPSKACFRALTECLLTLFQCKCLLKDMYVMGTFLLTVAAYTKFKTKAYSKATMDAKRTCA